jgi:phospho-N-acetylmuramoyl-pentapeptide-transferase
MLAFGVLGVLDDLKGLRDTAGVGWLARSKFPWQWVVGGALALFVYLGGAAGSLWLPWASQRLDLGLAFIPLGALLLVGWVNATNLADGLDGLAGGMSAMVLGALAALALMQGHAAVAWWTAAVAGGTLAFLWYNVNPARVFMGDVGAEGLGAAMAMVALVTGHALLLVIAGLVFVAVALSVLIQVSWFKYTRRRYGEGRRVFRMTPLHHHFEQLGWAEVQITQRFWLVTAVAIVLAFALWGTTG